MSEKLLDLLKIFLEKYLVPTVIAIVFSFIAYYVTPTDNKLLVKFTIWGVCCFPILRMVSNHRISNMVGTENTVS